MDFDNPKVYGDTSITDGLVEHLDHQHKHLSPLQISTMFDICHNFIIDADVDFVKRYTSNVTVNHFQNFY